MFSRPLTVLVLAPTLHAGAADAGALDLVRILRGAGHKVIVASNGGRLEDEVSDAGADFIRLDVADFNPIFIARAAFALRSIVRRERCDVIHAHGRAAAWAGLVVSRATGVPLITTWHKGHREQNIFKRLWNSSMVRGARVIAVSDQIAEMITERHRTPPEHIRVVPAAIDMARFNPALVSEDRLDTIRRSWGVAPDTKVILVVGRMLRRKGHHVVVKAVHRLKERGLKDFVCVFAGEDQGRTRYTGELWDLVTETGTSDVVRLTGAVDDDMPAAYAAATVVVSASIQPEGLAARDPRGRRNGAPRGGFRPRGGTRRRACPARRSGRPHDRLARSRGRRGGARGCPHPLVFIERCGPRRHRGARPRLDRRTLRCGQHRACDALALCRSDPGPPGLTDLQPSAANQRGYAVSALTPRWFIPMFEASGA